MFCLRIAYSILALFVLACVNPLASENGAAIKVQAIQNLAIKSGFKRLRLTWSLNPQRSSAVKVLRKESNTFNGSHDGTIAFEGKGESFVDRDLTEGKIYFYRIYALNESGTELEFVEGSGLAQYSSIEEGSHLVSRPIQEQYGFGSNLAVSGKYRVTSSLKGSVFVFERKDNTWVKVQTLATEDIVVGDSCGQGLAIENDLLAYSCPGAQNGRGKVFVFEKSASTWDLVTTLSSDSPDDGDAFGVSISISDQKLLIGAERDERKPSGPVNAGMAHLFEKVSNVWTQTRSFSASDAKSGDWFGHVVDIQKDTIAISAPTKGDTGFELSGAVYVFQNLGGTWHERGILTASDQKTEMLLGETSVQVMGDFIAVGEFRHDFNDVNKSFAGAVYMFRANGSSWEQYQKLSAPNIQKAAYFGWKIVHSKNLLAISAKLESGDGQLNRGGAYLFAFDGSSWVAKESFIPKGAIAFDSYGESLEMDEDYLWMGSVNRSIESSPGAGEIVEYLIP